MRTLSFTAVAAIALATSACENNDTGNDMAIDANFSGDAMSNDDLGMNTADNAATAKMPTDASGFANAVAASDLYEIESAKLAATKAGSADIKTFAPKLRADHEKSTADLKAAAAKASPAVTVTPVLDAEKQGMLDELKAANGADFDRVFIDQQTTAHQKAVGLLKNYVSAGDSQPLKDFASKSIAVVEGHLDHLNGIRK